MVLRPALFNFTPLNRFRPLVNTPDTSSSVLPDVRHTRRRGLHAPNARISAAGAEDCLRDPPIFKPAWPHEPRPYTCGWPGAQTCHVHPSLPLPSSSIAAGLSSLSMPLHSTGASLGPQLFRAPVPLLWLYLPGRSLSTTTMLSNHRDPGGDRLVSFLLVSLRSVEYLSTPAVLKAR